MLCHQRQSDLAVRRCARARPRPIAATAMHMPTWPAAGTTRREEPPNSVGTAGHGARCAPPCSSVTVTCASAPTVVVIACRPVRSITGYQSLKAEQMTRATSMQSTLTATRRKQRPSREERAKIHDLISLALKLRDKAVELNASPDLIKHGDWYFDRALFARQSMRVRGIPLLVDRVIRDLLSVCDAYRHANYGIYQPAGSQLTGILEMRNVSLKAAKVGRKISN